MDQSVGINRSTRRTLGQQLAANSEIGPGFDWLRIGLSLSILFWHSFVLAYGSVLLTDPTAIHRLAFFRPLVGCMLPMFFALSGFLVMGSAHRLDDLGTFITFRVLRIVPALATEITLSAVVLGGFLTSLSLNAYFTDRKFLEYFGSLFGRVRYSLPGVFSGNPVPDTVNTALWTVGPEILCYVIMSLAIMTTLHRRREWLLGLVAGYLVICLTSDFFAPPWMLDILPTKVLVFAFLIGNLAFAYRFEIAFSQLLAVASAIAAPSLIALILYNNDFVYLSYLVALALAYLTIYIGLLRVPKLPILGRGDYSYGVYIFGFPIQQTVVYFLPYRTWWMVFIFSCPMTLCVAAFSWHWLEKPALAMRKTFLSESKVTPVPPSQWSARQWLLATVIVAYGILVADMADVFPYRMIGHNLLHDHTPFVPRNNPFENKPGPV
jgi:peptidoglycan/LPS O-acetylase OafA/YrhL